VAKGHAYQDRAQRLVEAAVRAQEEVRIQRDAGQVALTNLRDHFRAISRDADKLSRRHEKQAEKHRKLLENFNPNLRVLEQRPLHPALGTALRDSVKEGGREGGRDGGGGTWSSSSATGSVTELSVSPLEGGSSSSRVSPSPPGVECEALRKACSAPSSSITLYDTVPVGRVTEWYRECGETRERLDSWMRDVQASLRDLQAGVEAPSALRVTADMGTAAQEEVDEITRRLSEQETAVALLEGGHAEMLERIETSLGGEAAGPDALPSSSPSSSAKLVDTCQWLDGLLTRQAGVVVSLDSTDETMVGRLKAVFAQKERTARWLRGLLAEISRLQGDIQSLRVNLSLGEQAMQAERRHFSHLEHLEHLPTAYEALLLELARRRAYARLFDFKVKSAVDGIARFREEEIQARADFLRRHASHLMPVFSQIFAGMQDRPPHFQAKPLAMEARLPVVRSAELLVGEEGEKEGKEGDEEEEDELLKGYVSCLARVSREEGADREEEGKEAGKDGGKEIMPGAESTPTLEELEERCMTQDLVIAQLQTKVQSLNLHHRAPPGRKKSGDAGGGGDGEGAGARLQRVEEENSLLRSCMETVLNVMEEMRQCAASTGGSGSGCEAEKEQAVTRAREGGREAAKGAGSPSPSSSPQHLVNAVDDTASFVKARLRDLQAELQASRGEGKERGKEGVLPCTNMSPSTPSISISPAPSSPGSHAKISFREFNVGDVALFLPTSHQGENRVYLAFHTNCPHRYLSHESLESLRGGREGGGRFPDFILGKIVYVEEMVAKEGEPASNPYHLQAGVKFYVLHVSNEVV
jgi:hypothetical protein